MSSQQQHQSPKKRHVRSSSSSSNNNSSSSNNNNTNNNNNNTNNTNCKNKKQIMTISVSLELQGVTDLDPAVPLRCKPILVNDDDEIDNMMNDDGDDDDVDNDEQQQQSRGRRRRRPREQQQLQQQRKRRQQHQNQQQKRQQIRLVVSVSRTRSIDAEQANLMGGLLYEQLDRLQQLIKDNLLKDNNDTAADQQQQKGGDDDAMAVVIERVKISGLRFTAEGVEGIKAFLGIHAHTIQHVTLQDLLANPLNSNNESTRRRREDELAFVSLLEAFQETSLKSLDLSNNALLSTSFASSSAPVTTSTNIAATAGGAGIWGHFLSSCGSSNSQRPSSSHRCCISRLQRLTLDYVTMDDASFLQLETFFVKNSNNSTDPQQQQQQQQLQQEAPQDDDELALGKHLRELHVVLLNPLGQEGMVAANTILQHCERLQSLRWVYKRGTREAKLPWYGLRCMVSNQSMNKSMLSMKQQQQQKGLASSSSTLVEGDCEEEDCDEESEEDYSDEDEEEESTVPFPNKSCFLQHLVMEGARIKERELGEGGLCGALQELSGLKTLKLRNLGLIDSAVNRIVAALQRSQPPLQLLDMGYNSIQSRSVESLEELATAVRIIQSLKAVCLAHNKLDADAISQLRLIFEKKGVSLALEGNIVAAPQTTTTSSNNNNKNNSSSSLEDESPLSPPTTTARRNSSIDSTTRHSSLMHSSSTRRGSLESHCGSMMMMHGSSQHTTATATMNSNNDMGVYCGSYGGDGGASGATLICDDSSSSINNNNNNSNSTLLQQQQQYHYGRQSPVVYRTVDKNMISVNQMSSTSMDGDDLVGRAGQMSVSLDRSNSSMGYASSAQMASELRHVQAERNELWRENDRIMAEANKTQQHLRQITAAQTTILADFHMLQQENKQLKEEREILIRAFHILGAINQVEEAEALLERIGKLEDRVYGGSNTISGNNSMCSGGNNNNNNNTRKILTQDHRQSPTFISNSHRQHTALIGSSTSLDISMLEQSSQRSYRTCESSARSEVTFEPSTPGVTRSPASTMTQESSVTGRRRVIRASSEVFEPLNPLYGAGVGGGCGGSGNPPPQSPMSYTRRRGLANPQSSSYSSLRARSHSPPPKPPVSSMRTGGCMVGMRGNFVNSSVSRGSSYPEEQGIESQQQQQQPQCGGGSSSSSIRSGGKRNNSFNSQSHHHLDEVVEGSRED